MILVGILVIVVIILIAVVLFLLPKAQQTVGTDTKIASVPAEIKTPKEAATLQQDSASVVREIDSVLDGIENSLPDV